MGKILVSVSHYDSLCVEAKEYLESKGHEVIFDSDRIYPSYSKEELKQLLYDVDGAIIGMDIYDEEVFSFAPKLKAVAKFGVGVDNIDGAAAARHGVYVINAPGKNSCAVAELTVGMMICLLRRLPQLNNAVKSGAWPRVMGTELCGKTVGLVGFGAISQLLAQRLAAFGVNVLAYDVMPNKAAAEACGVELCGLDDVLSRSDIISLHVPALPSTYHIINRQSIARMKNGVYLVNTARGPLVDTEALSEALHSGKITAAALDVYELEPLPADAELLKCDNLVCTPHIGGETREAYQKLAMSTAKDIAAVLDGEEPCFCTNRTLLRGD